MIALLCALILQVTLAAPAFAGKVLAEIEYFYADDGTLTGKAFNGNRVNFEYDLRGQLLAVKDAQGKDLERYTYDPAGNRLSKTINGVTTTYTYDKANQLVTSTVNGVTTHYKYDAAGRMVQAGDKSYIRTKYPKYDRMEKLLPSLNTTLMVRLLKRFTAIKLKNSYGTAWRSSGAAE